MSDELVFYTNPMSRARLVRWMLEEVGQPYRTETLDYGTTMKAPDYLAINPMGKVPAITHKGKVVTECAAICAYLADAFPDAGLAPPTAGRADYYRWLFFAAGPLDAAIVDKALGRSIPPDRAAMVGYSGLDAVVGAIADALAGKAFIAAGHFTAADCFVGASLSFHMRFGTIERRPAFLDYVERLEARPAFLRSIEIDGAMPPPKVAA
ncbi:glutathione S-transferase family protein [Sphingomonas sp. CGMCC 1.13654]|uniref:Glutathione S-transferase family protein n=1 Tax=Sphingomonas chungangi TaxID=2683589 RepID=A0A838L470_9SPHN|nr:glutathione S-transferase family protein [Sphingomonas chungangi]MBA2932996.1 glutathione S-transferase family protein [Sphingomonas chungangi]MVW56616.1 glutathione S-transferase [Sphingomonas chungangi]